MNVSKHVEPLRIEIRAVTPTNDAPWFLLRTAKTKTQAKDLIKREAISADFETQVVANETITAVEPEPKDTEATALLLQQLNEENLGLKRDLNAAQEKLKEFVKPAPVVPDPNAGKIPVPFEVGQHVRDVHTGTIVRVSALESKFRSGKPRAGFEWINPLKKPGEKDATGFCPPDAFACYVPAKKNEIPDAPASDATANA